MSRAASFSRLVPYLEVAVSDPITRAELESLRQAAQDAGSEPWVVHEGNVWRDDRGDFKYCVTTSSHFSYGESFTAHIAAADPATVLRLIALVEELSRFAVRAGDDCSCWSVCDCKEEDHDATCAVEVARALVGGK